MTVAWLKTGNASADAQKQHQAEVEKKKQEMGKAWRFFLKQDENGCAITFVDGELSKDGFLLPPRFYEHNLQEGMPKRWGHYYVCPEKTMPDGGDDMKCPICESGDKPYLAAAFTIIDHRTFETKEGKKITNSRKLLIAKPQSFELLNKIAIKRGGLAGARFDVSRIGEKSASIGTMFDFTEKQPIADLKKLYTLDMVDPKTNTKKTMTYFLPLDYDKEFVFRSGVELRKLGHGKPLSVNQGVQKAQTQEAQQTATEESGVQDTPAGTGKYEELL